MDKLYQKKNLQPMRPYVPGEDMSGVSVANGITPALGGMIACNPDDVIDVWYVDAQYFMDNYQEVPELSERESVGTDPKSLGNTDQNGARKNVKDIVIFGEDLFKLLSKASSQAECWMKSTKAMQLHNGCLVQVTTQQGDNVAEALEFVPGASIVESVDGEGNVTGRMLGYLAV